MTNDDLKKKYSAIFQFHFLISDPDHPGCTLLAGTQHRPTAGSQAFAYVPQLDDFMKIDEKMILSQVRLKTIKSQI